MSKEEDVTAFDNQNMSLNNRLYDLSGAIINCLSLIIICKGDADYFFYGVASLKAATTGTGLYRKIMSNKNISERTTKLTLAATKHH